MIELTAIGQDIFDKANSDTALDVPCILVRDTEGSYGRKLSLVQACALHGRLGVLIAGMFETSKASLRARGFLTARERPAPSPRRSTLEDASNAASDPTRAREQAAFASDASPVSPSPRADTTGLPPLGAFIRTRRRSLRMSQAVLAKRAGLSWHGVWSVENGAHRPRDVTLRAIAAAIRVEPRVLFELKAKNKKRESDAA